MYRKFFFKKKTVPFRRIGNEFMIIYKRGGNRGLNVLIELKKIHYSIILQ